VLHALVVYAHSSCLCVVISYFLDSSLFCGFISYLLHEVLSLEFHAFVLHIMYVEVINTNQLKDNKENCTESLCAS